MLFLFSDIAIERCIAIFKPLHYPQIVTSRRMIIALVLIWVYSLFLGLIMFAGSFVYIPGMPCLTFLVCNDGYIHTLCIHIVVYILIIGIIYIFILRVIRQQQRRVASSGGNENSADSASQLKQNLQIIKTYAMIVGIFAICVLPTVLMLEMQHYDSGRFQFTSEYHLLIRLAMMFLIINSAANPCVYALRMKSFRQPMKQILCCKALDQDVPNGASTATNTTSA